MVMIYNKKRRASLLVKTLVVAMLLPTLSLDAQSKKATVTKKISVKTPSAASKPLLVLAKTEINQLRYSYAIPFLKRYLKQSPPDSISLAMLGYCYKMQNRFDSAIYFYEKLDNLAMPNGNELPELYATVGNYESAIATYQKRLDNITDNTTTTYQLYLNRQKGFINRKIFNRDSLDYSISYLSINTPYNEFGAAFFDSGFVFESNRSKRLTSSNEFGWDGLPFTKLYYQIKAEGISTDSIQYGNWKEKKIGKGLSDRTTATVNDNKSLQKQFDFQKLKSAPPVESPLFAPGLSGDYNFGSISFTADGREAFFTRNQTNTKGVKRLEIWTTRRIGQSFTAPVKLFFNNPNYSYFHPAVTADGSRLFFVSNEPGGIGGTDIYVVNRKEDGGWDGTSNVGGFINTPGNELFPTFYEGDLYFSSNGHEGLGGLDILKFSFDNDPYPVPKNLGRPINSEQDDLGFSIRDQKGYFSSNRYGSDDIFSYNYQKVKVSVNGVLTIDGVKKSGITVKIVSKGEDGIRAGTIIDSVLTAEDGSYVFNVRPNRNYQILIEDGKGNKSKHDITASDYINQNYLSQNIYSNNNGVNQPGNNGGLNQNKTGGDDKNISSVNNGVNQKVNNSGENQNKAGGDDKNISSNNNGLNQPGNNGGLNQNKTGGDDKNISSVNNGVNQKVNNSGENQNKAGGDGKNISSNNNGLNQPGYNGGLNQSKTGGDDKNISSNNNGLNQPGNNGGLNQNKAGGDDKNISSITNGVNQQGNNSGENQNKVGGGDKNVSSVDNGVNQQGNNKGNSPDKSSGDRTSNTYVNQSGNLNSYTKDLGLISFVTPNPPKPIIAPPTVEKVTAAKRTFISVVDSLQTVTKDFLLVHHEFDKVRIYKEDHEAYKDLVERVRKLRGVKIIIVSATDCLGTDAYNEALSERRSHKIKIDLSKKRGNEIISIPVGEKQLVMECSDADKDKKKQVENRYSYVFIIK
jgi:outer membrane protein OmpA-like peptidoglycan-associated protein